MASFQEWNLSTLGQKSELICFGSAVRRLLAVTTVREWRPHHAEMNVCRRVSIGLEFPAGLSWSVYERRSFNAFGSSGEYVKKLAKQVVAVMPFVENNTYER